MNGGATIHIGKHSIASGGRTFIIAEAGVNHDGSVDRARQLIDEAHAAGADAVKFQYFTADRLAAAETATCDYQKAHVGANASQRDMLRRLELNESDLRRLADHAGRVGILFLATPFGRDELRYLIRVIRVPALKIASPDIVNAPLLAAACAADLPLIVSTGASDEPEIANAVELIRAAGAADRLVLLHCVSAYPTEPSDARLGCIVALRERFGVPTGFSDHTREVDTGASAVLAGACILEKHFTLDKSAEGPDHFFSLEPGELRRYIVLAREAEVVRGNGRIGCTPAERQVRELARGRLVARRAILPGETISAEMFLIQRSGRGVFASELPSIMGRRLRVGLDSGKPLTAEHL